MMNIQRAKEISESPDLAKVTCNGTRVYIQNVNEKNETARIYPLNDPGREKDVPLSSLMEH